MKSPKEIVIACRKLADTKVNRSQAVILRKAADEIARIFEVPSHD